VFSIARGRGASILGQQLGCGPLCDLRAADASGGSGATPDVARFGWRLPPGASLLRLRPMPPWHGPLDERLGMGAGALSPGLSRAACRIGIDASLGETPSALAETLRVNVAQEASRRVTEGIGDVAEREEQELIVRAQAGREPWDQPVTVAAGSALLVEADGVQVHWEDDWHETKVGVLDQPETARDHQACARQPRPADRPTFTS
jgi:hypothetical protein